LGSRNDVFTNPDQEPKPILGDFRMADNSEDVYLLYRYNPSIAAAAVACVLFAIVTGVHSFQMYKSRAWFLIPLVLGGLCKLIPATSIKGKLKVSILTLFIVEVIGFAARAYSASQKAPDWSLGPYIIQSVLTLVAPALFAGSIYMILGRVILMTDGERYSMVRQKWLTKMFVCGDIFAFLLQASGKNSMLDARKRGTG
tara:strand:+ start:95 stop:691 length:597 start_codon:yes stop_codon:yes gene_type:complete